MQGDLSSGPPAPVRPERNVVRVHHAVVALLRADEVVTDSQLSNLGLHGERFPGLTMTIRPLPHSKAFCDVTFRALSRARLYAKPSMLPHQAGLAATRQALTATTAEWKVLGNSKSTCPDAEWHQDGRVIAVEYDAGYRQSVVRQKMQAFEEYDAVVWATPSPLRAERIQRKYPAVRVLTVDYWTACQT